MGLTNWMDVALDLPFYENVIPGFENGTMDKCPDDAEDYDSYQDEDGCPDLIHVAVSPVVVRDTVV